MQLEPHDLALYTEAYKRRAPETEVFQGSLQAWHRFATTKPLLYLPERTANANFDVRDRRRHLWTHGELHGFGDVVETRTRALLDAQEQLLRSWHAAATQIERIARGFVARQRVQKILDAIAAAANQLERAKLLVWLLKKQVAAALIVQRAYRRHIAFLAFVEVCRARLQRATRLFLFRFHRARAVRVIQRAFRTHRYRCAVHSHLRALCKLLRADRQQQQLHHLALLFTQSHEQARRAQQQQLWECFPDKMAQLQRVKQRQASIARALPLIDASRSQRRGGAKPRRTQQGPDTGECASISRSRVCASPNQTAAVLLPPLR